MNIGFIPRLFGANVWFFADSEEKAEKVDAMAISVASQCEGEKVKRALESDKFNELLRACRWGNFRIEWRMFPFFRKDIWRAFL